MRSLHGLFLRRRTGADMSATEAADMEEELRVLFMPDVEVCPAFSVREVFAVEARGGSIWTRVWPKCLITSADCVCSCVSLWMPFTEVETLPVSPVRGTPSRRQMAHIGACLEANVEKRHDCTYMLH